ncbi:MAG: hypothetical protein M3Q19_00570 [Pseudomonadota bacterium]|nr:hypothetical protein [Pseudomonadota bacterium]
MIDAKRTTLLAILAVIAGGCAPSKPAGAPAPLAELAGRTAGAPQRCVPIGLTGSMRIAAPQTILYGSGRTIWVNRLPSPCARMALMDVVIVEPLGTQYCRGDLVRTVNAVSKIPGPACPLGDFVPYTR